MRKTVIRAIHTWHFTYLIAASLLFAALGPAFAIFINDPIPIFIFSVAGILVLFLVWRTTGSLLTAKCIVSESEIEIGEKG